MWPSALSAFISASELQFQRNLLLSDAGVMIASFIQSVSWREENRFSIHLLGCLSIAVKRRCESLISVCALITVAIFLFQKCSWTPHSLKILFGSFKFKTSHASLPQDSILYSPYLFGQLCHFFKLQQLLQNSRYSFFVSTRSQYCVMFGD